MNLKRIVAVAAASAVALSAVVAISTPSQAAAVNYCKATDLKTAGGMDALVKAAKKEGALNVITLPRDWANYGEAMDLFSKAFGIKINDDNPDGSSAYEIQTIKTAPAAKQPDVVDIGVSALNGVIGAGSDKLFADYKVANFAAIPSKWKSESGNWYGDYNGIIGIAYDASVTPAPTKIADLANAAYKGQVALTGDPTAGQEPFMAVYAAAIAKGGSTDNIQPGIDFFKSLKASGNFIATKATPENYVAGAYKVSLTWNFNAPGMIAGAKAAGKNLKFVIPTDAVIAGTPYIQAINAKAPHCAAARLWEEFLYSENKGKTSTQLTPADLKLTGSKLFNTIQGGQNVFVSGGATPILQDDMTKKKTLINGPDGFDVPKGAKVYQPSPDQQVGGKTLVSAQWPTL
jgi:putative spermidine/putrescine transport system substrate-binding protein